MMGLLRVLRLRITPDILVHLHPADGRGETSEVGIDRERDPARLGEVV